MRLPRRPPARRDQDGPWMKQQKHILITLAFFAGGAMFASQSSTIRDSWSNHAPHLRVRRRGSPQKSGSSQSLRASQNRSVFSTPSSSLLSAFDVVEIPINPYSTLREDVKSIEHLPAFSRIDIRMKDGARCPRPYVMGRLSGPALVMLQDWKWSPIQNHRKNTNTTILTGHYQAPESGQYNLEIIALHCHDFLHNMKQKGHLGWAHNGTDTWDLDIDEAVCMEDPWRHRLTSKIAPVAVDHTVGAFVQHSNKGDKGGNWRNQGWQQIKRPEEQKPLPVYTRFHSTKGAFDGGSRAAYIHDRHQLASELAQNIPKEKLKELEQARICLVGPSQSHLQQHLFRQRISELLGKENKTDSNPILSWESIESPSHVTQDFAKRLVEQQKCHKLVLMDMNPWSLRKADDKNTPIKIGNFYHAIYGMLANLFNFVPSISGGSQPMEIYIVSLPYHSLDASMTSCPPSNWKTPPLIDGYNAAIAKACDDHGGSASNVNFVDTRPLVSPVWDFFDENSPAGQTSKHALTAESLHVARTVLGLLDTKAELEIFAKSARH